MANRKAADPREKKTFRFNTKETEMMKQAAEILNLSMTETLVEGLKLLNKKIKRRKLANAN